jgi:predicted membrane channel-forming protein YqfA (hemolysin III family)
MARTTILRIMIFVALCIGGLVGVWQAHSFGSSILGPVGGALIAFIAALVVSASAYIVGAFFFGGRPQAGLEREAEDRSERRR